MPMTSVRGCTLSMISLAFKNIVGGNAEAGMGDDLVGGIALIDRGLEDLHALAGNLGTAQAADQFLALPRKHGPTTTSIQPILP